MKISRGKMIAFILTLLLLVPLVLEINSAAASAATPTLNKTSLEFEGIGEEFDLNVNDKVTGSKYKWTTSNSKVARVSSNGIVTTTGAGTATIKCKITLPNNTTKTLSCTVTVRVPATGIKINNATEVKGAHQMTIGDKFNFNRDIVPSNSSDKTYWSIGGGDSGCIRIDDDQSGIVTALKEGYVVLKATAVKSFNNEDIKKSIVNDAVIIKVVAPTATVKSAEIISSNEIKVVFDSPVKPETIIGANKKLLDSIELRLGYDLKGKLAKDPGELTASLSSDGKTLTINCKDMFDGVYGINFSDKITTTTGLTITPFYAQMKFVDEVAPQVLSTVLDDTGMVNTIPFSETINFTNFRVSNARLLPTANATSADQSTISYLNNTLNYIISSDKKSVSINLSQITPSDYGKMFTITISGIEDLSGNRPAGYTLTTVVYTDTSYKPQARPLVAARTAYDRLTITFDRSIRNPGMAKIGNNGLMMNGVVDSLDPKKVNYTLYDMDQALSGPQTVYVGYWDSYNVNPSDITANQLLPLQASFSTETTLPFLVSQEFDPVTNVLTLTYTEEVTTAYSSGVFACRLLTTGDEIGSATITYTRLDTTDRKQIRLQLGNMTLAGQYIFTLEQGFAIDNFRNKSQANQVSISNAGGTASQLPPPYLIAQSSTNLSQIYLEFANMLDLATAVNVSNYSIAGVQILSAEVVKNQRDGGATVVLTVADGSIDVTVERPVTIKGLMGYGGVLSPMDTYTTYVELKDNKKPYYTGQISYNKSTGTISLGFSEEITGTMTVRVTQIMSNSTYPIEYANTVTVSGNSVNIFVIGTPMANSYLRIDILENRITDLSGNQCVAMSAQLGVPTGN